MNRPNIVCVSLDSVRADFCSFINEEEQTTPFLKSLSSDSAIFGNAVTPATWTLPAHTSVFTGLYPEEHRVTGAGTILGDHPTFPELLSEYGYTNRAFYRNSWLQTGDVLRGIPTFNDQSSKKPSKKQELSNYISIVSPKVNDALRTGYIRLAELKESTFHRDVGSDDSTVSEAVSALSDVREPFCWFIHLNDAHWPYTPPAPFHQTFTNRLLPFLLWNRWYWQHRMYNDRDHRFRTWTGMINPPEREVETIKNLYRGCIRYLDSLLHQLVNGLRNADVWDQTIFIVFADHGDCFGEGGIYGHHLSLDDAVIHVPLLVRDPTEHLQPGRVSTPVQLNDIYPTILELTDVPGPETHSISLCDSNREYAFASYDGTEYVIDAISELDITLNDLPPTHQYAIRSSDTQRLTWYPELDEYQGPSADKQILRVELHNHLDSLKPIQPQTKEIDNSIMEQLEDMGYLG